MIVQRDQLLVAFQIIIRQCKVTDNAGRHKIMYWYINLPRDRRFLPEKSGVGVFCAMEKEQSTLGPKGAKIYIVPTILEIRHSNKDTWML